MPEEKKKKIKVEKLEKGKEEALKKKKKMPKAPRSEDFGEKIAETKR